MIMMDGTFHDRLTQVMGTSVSPRQLAAEIGASSVEIEQAMRGECELRNHSDDEVLEAAARLAQGH